MALGGGTWVTQTEILPGAYINNVSVKNVDTLVGDRGTVAIATTLNWGKPNTITEVGIGDFYNSPLELFGYNTDAPELINIREAFKKAKKILLYRLDNGGVKAANKHADAKYPGIRGNDLKIVIRANVETEGRLKDVITMLDNVKVDIQTVENSSDLKDNSFVSFKKEQPLELTRGLPLTDGTNGSGVSLSQHNDFLTELESYSFNVLACTSTDVSTKKLYITFTERMRRDIGKNFQVVVHNYPEADSYSVISVKNGVDEKLVYWVAGACAGVDVNETLTNKVYNGEYEVEAKYTQAELTIAIKNGEFVLHRCEDEIRVLLDINTLLTYSDDINSDFSKNQVIRTLDVLAAEYSNIFTNEFLGKIPNDDSGRIALWNRYLDVNKKYAEKRAILPTPADDLTVLPGVDKDSVFMKSGVTPVTAMTKIYIKNQIR